QSVTRGGPDGLEIAIDVLSHFGSLVIAYAFEFWRKDVDRWEASRHQPRYHVNDDYWYVLLRAIASSHIEARRQRQFLRYGEYLAEEAPPRVREALVHALGDLGGPGAVDLVRRMHEGDTSPMVRETAAEVLRDLEG